MSTPRTTPDIRTGRPVADYARIVDDLSYRYDGVFSRETVAQAVQDARTHLEPLSRVPDYLPILTERFARDRLLAAAQAEGRIATSTPELLFVCVRNAGRSQIAAALAQHLSGGRVHVRSAGSAPTGEMLPFALQVLRERDIDVTEAFPKPLTTTSSTPRTSSSPWAAATPAPSSPESGTRTGTWPTPPTSPSRSSEPSRTTSRSGSPGCSPSFASTPADPPHPTDNPPWKVR
jgi:hypothetical protein